MCENISRKSRSTWAICYSKRQRNIEKPIRQGLLIQVIITYYIEICLLHVCRLWKKIAYVFLALFFCKLSTNPFRLYSKKKFNFAHVHKQQSLVYKNMNSWHCIVFAHFDEEEFIFLCLELFSWEEEIFVPQVSPNQAQLRLIIFLRIIILGKKENNGLPGVH